MRYVDKDATQSADWDKWTDNVIQTAGGRMFDRYVTQPAGYDMLTVILEQVASRGVDSCDATISWL